ncbi:NAD(P)-dependent alcohol dehydrogenase [Streptomyces flavofungini]|uniref:NAD(P)-dependent alcohol dehydrogenase n=1 Tax=Streptomyces flavofungini TaxID=68200 RepID=UPI0025B1B6C8|nr:NAD(P)-dependent alcohol dehydrogenase [Streptomyces flavofungini]WJV50995.1 NAD(P)-dependent alcohol dehydrogenase [Streptomyces flavofungini]
MKAIVQDVYGSADTLHVRDVERPSPGEGQVLVRVHAAGVGPDVLHVMTGLPLMARAFFGLRRPRNPVRGWDGAGRVESVGAKVTGVEPGDAVYGHLDGSFAEYALAKAERIAPKPGNINFVQAAAVPVSAVTALQALHAKAGLRAGQRVLVIGASGGVGSFAVQLAVAHGAEVTGVCGGRAAAFVRSLGATAVLDHTRQEITETPHRYDVVVDAAGNRPLPLLRRALTPHGTLVRVGGEGGSRWFGDTGTQLRMALLTRFARHDLLGLWTVVRRADLVTLTSLIESGAITPSVDSAYPLAEARAAVRRLERGHPRGKVVLTVSPGA